MVNRNKTENNDIYIEKKINVNIYVGNKKLFFSGGNNLEILFFDKGVGKIGVNTKEFNIKEREYALLKNCDYRCVLTAENESLKVFRLSLTKQTLPLYYDLELFDDCSVFEDDDELVKLFKLIENENRHKALYYEEYINSIVRCIFLQIIRKSGIDKSQDRDHLEEVVANIAKYIDENMNKNLTLESLAYKFSISESYLSHSFKSILDMSPINYLINMRISYAKKLLSNTNHNICEISEKVGYQNQNYFSYLFKKVTGMSPSNFRLNIKRNL